jgi:hypothetical protein
MSRNVYRLTKHDGDTRATYVSTNETAEALQRVPDGGGRGCDDGDQPGSMS